MPDERDELIDALTRRYAALADKYDRLKHRMAADGYGDGITGSFALESESKSGAKKSLKFLIYLRQFKIAGLLAAGGAGWHSIVWLWTHFHR